MVKKKLIETQPTIILMFMFDNKNWQCQQHHIIIVCTEFKEKKVKLEVGAR